MSKLRNSNCIYPAPAAFPVETVSVWRLLSLVPGLGLALATVLASTNIGTSAHRVITLIILHTPGAHHPALSTPYSLTATNSLLVGPHHDCGVMTVLPSLISFWLDPWPESWLGPGPVSPPSPGGSPGLRVSDMEDAREESGVRIHTSSASVSWSPSSLSLSLAGRADPPGSDLNPNVQIVPSRS